MKGNAREPPNELTKESHWSIKPLSTVSYNTDNFLNSALQCLIDEQVILNYAYIKHKGEGSTKDHIHLLLIPAKKVDLVRLRESFEEPDPGNDKPLGIMPFQTTNENNYKDWYLYVLHDEDYLLQKGMKRLYHYKKDDIIAYDQELIERLSTELEQRLSEIEVMLSYIESGFHWFHVAKRLKIPMSQMKIFRETYEMLRNEFDGFSSMALDIVNGDIDYRVCETARARTESELKNENNELRLTVNYLIEHIDRINQVKKRSIDKIVPLDLNQYD